MIIQFSLANFRSVHHVQTIRFRATSLVSENKAVDQKNIAEVGDYRVLKAMGIYGANGSGKSNFIRGLAFFRLMVRNSLTVEDFSKTEFSPFRLTTETMDNAGYFEMVLVIEGKKYRYGFTLNEEAAIAAEWLSGPAEKNETYYFQRKDGIVTVNPLWFQEGDDLPKEKLRGNALFLSFCASYDGIISSSIRNFISEKISVDPANRRRSGKSSSSKTDLLVEAGNKAVILKWMKEAGLFYTDIELQKLELGGRFYGNIVVMNKNIYNEKGEITGNVPMYLEEDESEGTKKFYSYIGNLHQKFEEGGLFISDEIDSNFHPSLLRRLLCYFNDPVINKAGAQVLFTSHDTNLMDHNIMRRDQFYFTEKSLSDETILYALSDLKGVRNNADFARQYLAGIYGALPVLGNYLNE